MAWPVVVEGSEHLRATGREKEIVAAYAVLRDFQHWSTAIRIERVALGEAYAAGVVDAATGGQPLFRVRGGVGDEVGNLLALNIDDS
jgi:hypothetical protein